MKKTKSLILTAGLALVLAAAALPAAAQVDLSKFVQLGDSYSMGVLDGCVVKHGQVDAYGAIIARQAGVDFQMPLLDEPGVGGCMFLKSLAPDIGNKPSVVKPLNLTLPRPYNNLAISGYKTKDVTDAKSSADNGNALTDLVLRGLGGGTTALQQAASLKPSFVTVWIGGNDVLGGVLAGTVIDGITVTKVADFTPKYQQIVDTLKAAQGGKANGVVIGLADFMALPFVSAIPPVIVVGGKPVINPVTGAPFTYLGSKDGKPIPLDSALTLVAANFLKTGYGIPCAILDAGGVPAGSALRQNCNKPLPDTADAKTGTPGVILYPDEVALVKKRSDELTTAIKSIGEAAGFKFFDIRPFWNGMVANGRNIGGMTVATPFLSGGFFGYDGFHPTSTGQAIIANELIQFVNGSFGGSISEVDLSTYLFNGNTSAGGYPIGAAPLSAQESLDWAAAIFTPERYQNLSKILGVRLSTELEVGNSDEQLHQVERGDRGVRSGN